MDFFSIIVAIANSPANQASVEDVVEWIEANQNDFDCEDKMIDAFVFLYRNDK